MSGFLHVFVQLFVTVLWLLVIGRVLLSWVNPTFSGAVGRFLFNTTEPLLMPIRRLLPSTGMIDLAPLVLILVLGFVLRLVLLV